MNEWVSDSFLILTVSLLTVIVILLWSYNLFLHYKKQWDHVTNVIM